MRYYNINTKTESEYINDDITIRQDDNRVASFFRAELLCNEELLYDNDGFPYIKIYTLDNNGNRYSKYNADGTPDLEAIHIEQVANELASKIAELEVAKDTEQNKPALVRGVEFFGGRLSGQKYKEAFDLAKLLGKTTGEVRAVSGMVTVDEEYINEVLVAIGLASYQAWYKLQQRRMLVDNAKTLDEIKAIEW